MIKYDLALALKNAGFPQDLKYSFTHYSVIGNQTPLCDCDYRFDNEHEQYVKIPTLSELVEACGDKFGALTQYDKQKGEGWFASGHKIIWDSDENGYICVKEETPEIAVANLYLEINSKE